ncbi:MAG: DUF3853 family protein [Bacteroidales bacterium]|jgi:hypothetical protein|nr:DUF3853 family protein [Bacteroidales bacterium]
MQTEKLSFENLPEAVSELLAKMQKIESFMEATPAEATPADPEPFIYGIKGLAIFLKVSTPTAQKIKNSGRIPFSQAERTIIFRKADVLEALSNKKRR